MGGVTAPCTSLPHVTPDTAEHKEAVQPAAAPDQATLIHSQGETGHQPHGLHSSIKE